MPVRQMTSVRIEPAASTWQAPPKDFILAATEAAGRIAADFLPVVELWERPFRVIVAGALITGREVFRKFKQEIPVGVRLDPVAMSFLLESGPHAETGLIATDPPARGGSPSAEPLFFRCWGKMGGLPSDGVNAASYVGVKEAVAGPALWVLVEDLLASHGFKSADLGVFATSPAVASAIAKAALTVVQARHLDLSARDLAALQAKLAGKLGGWDSGSYSAPNAMSLWDEAIAEAFANSRPEKLPGLVKLLGPRAPAEPAGGAA